MAERKLYSAAFEATGVFWVEADSYDEAVSEVGDALIGLEGVEPGVGVEVHAVSFDRDFEEDDL